uniref:Fibronectin type-III domain-containing protein n=1 Tax=Macrostomum lignano TaxID=282301 RepID=A0A1I8JDD9_9PLAT
RLEHLQPGSEYSVKVIPVSQTLTGTPAQLKFVTTGGGGGGSMTIVVAVAVSVLVAMAIAAGLLGWVWHRRRSRRTDQNQQSTSMEKISKGLSNQGLQKERRSGNSLKNDSNLVSQQSSGDTSSSSARASVHEYAIVVTPAVPTSSEYVEVVGTKDGA